VPDKNKRVAACPGFMIVKRPGLVAADFDGKAAFVAEAQLNL
jgi:hypothetical protein